MKEKIYLKEIGDKNSSHTLIFFHDFWDYHKSYVELANQIFQNSQKKISVILIDCPGFGLSGGTRGHLDSLDEYCLEIGKIISKIKKQKVIFGGHGFGSLIALKMFFKFDYTYENEVTSLFLSNPFFSFQEYFTKGFKDTAYFLNSSLGKLKVPYTNAEKLLTTEMKKDPLNCKKISFRLFGQVCLDGEIATDWGVLVDIPLFLMTGSALSFYSRDEIDKFAEKIENKYKTTVDYEDFGHWLFQNESSSDIIAELSNWILKANNL